MRLGVAAFFSTPGSYFPIYSKSPLPRFPQPLFGFPIQRHKDITANILARQKDGVVFLQKATLQHHTTHVFNEFPKKIKLYQLTSKHFDSVILKGSGDVRGSKSFPWAHTKMICGISTNIS